MSNAQKQLELATDLAELWQGLFPQYETPSRAQFLAWADMASADEVIFAINRTARKVRREEAAGSPMTADRAARYLTGTLRNERDGRHIFTAPTDQPFGRRSAAIQENHQ